jgi:tetratricopeptide (TPR) repeat protein
MVDTNRAFFADEHLQRALDTGGMTPDLARVTANVARAKAQIPEAIELYKAALALAPDDPHCHAMLASCYEAAGDVEKCGTVIEAATVRFPDDLNVRRSRALYRSALKDFAGAVSILSQGGEARPLDILDRGRYLDRLGDAAGAWADWSEAKRIMRDRGVLRFQSQEFEACLSSLAQFANKKRLRFIPKEKFERPKVAPLFITGFPRSGTTMIETAIAGHPKILAGDELSMLPELVNVMPAFFRSPAFYPSCLMAAGWGDNVAAFGLLRDWYLRRASFRVGINPKAPAAGVEFFTDKMPLNEMHIPLILRLFPESPILYVRRHPLDTIVSNFSYYISHGWGYAAALESCVRVVTVFDALVMRYRDLFPGKIHQIKYEDFVSHQVDQLAGAFAHIFDTTKIEPPPPASINFHQSDRFSRTISHRQIKEPLYDRSVGRYKPYLKFLAPVLEQVRPMCEREGYAI